MGAPDLPNDPGEDLPPAHVVHHPLAPSDDSDNDSLPDGSNYDGYQPLAMDDYAAEYGHIPLNYNYTDNSVVNNNEDFNRLEDYTDIVESGTAFAACSDPNIPLVESADVQIQREVWNQPRPRELQIELDSNKTQQILKAMANFELPNLAVPDWAAGVPEESWKEDLLQRIRQRLPSEETK